MHTITNGEVVFKRVRHAQREWNSPLLTYDEMKVKSANPSANTYIIDVREPDEFAEGAIPSSINLPLSTLMDTLKLPNTKFKEIFGVNKPEKGHDITFYCLKGIRSVTATDIAKSNGYTNISDYSGSWVEWAVQPDAQIFFPESESSKLLETRSQA